MTELNIVEEPITIVIDGDGDTTAVEAEEVTLVISDVGAQGIPGADGAQGPQGDPGPQGPQGDPGAPGSAPQAYIHDQGTPALIWTVTHNLGYNPNVSVVDSAETVVEGSVVYTSLNALTIEFTAAFGGKAYLS